ncbi:phosphoribosylanthranilate isomerase [Alphaproteobacteria bacterium]|nr:phosphoribosylanthranilate isomerase [Alphaproteobacteria bacterium]
MSHSFEIKICGINDQISMSTAIDNGVNYIGLVFYDKSPRNLSITKAKILAKNRTKKSKIVALTVNPDDVFLQEIKNCIKPDYIQLHGEETPNRCKNIRDKFNIPLIKGIGIEKNIDLKRYIKPYAEICDILILDAPSEELPGGNGKKFDWEILKNYKSKKKWMLAGGLNINNISEAIDKIKPPAIDISSGLETRKGVKDPQLIKNFVLKCKNL